jgi:hypothetical protein
LNSLNPQTTKTDTKTTNLNDFVQNDTPVTNIKDLNDPTLQP